MENNFLTFLTHEQNNSLFLLRYDTIHKNVIISLSHLVIKNLNCQINIQLFLQQYRKSGVSGDTN